MIASPLANPNVTECGTKPMSPVSHPHNNYPEFDVLHYDRWNICSDDCSFGKELKVSVYEFLKDPLIRKYGAGWYEELVEFVGQYKT